MDVTAWYNSRKGQSLLVPGADEANRGQCVQAADYWLNEGFGLPYVWANAIDWWNLPGSLAGNFYKVTDGSALPGDFIVYSEGLVKYGHIDIVAQAGTTAAYVGYDSNWGGDKTLHTVVHNQPQYNKYILGALRRKGQDVADVVDRGGLETIWRGFLDRIPTDAEYSNFVGKGWAAVLFTALTSQEYKDRYAGLVKNYQLSARVKTLLGSDITPESIEQKMKDKYSGSVSDLPAGTYLKVDASSVVTVK